VVPFAVLHVCDGDIPKEKFLDCSFGDVFFSLTVPHQGSPMHFVIVSCVELSENVFDVD
jgi:hypothetical protein